MNIGVDVDGVLRNIFPAMAKAYFKNGGHKYWRFKDFKDYDITKYMDLVNGKEAFFRENAEEIFHNAKMTKYANWINCIPEKHQVSIVTSQFRGLEDLTIDWLKENGIAYDAIYFTWRKNLILVDALVDDYPVNLDMMKDSVVKVCYDAPYNRRWEGIRTKNMKDFVENVLPKVELSYEIGQSLDMDSYRELDISKFVKKKNEN